jgi:outer membrane cobalamin receptor
MAASFPFRPSIRLFVIFTLMVVAAAGRAAGGSVAVASGGSITGIVSDPDGRPVADAQVLLTQAASVAARVRTGADGRFRVDALPPGPYQVHVAREGFRAEPQAVVVVEGEAREVNVRLRLSAVSESVVVSASQLDVPLSLVADSASVITARDLSARQIETVADALRLVPGVEVARNGGRGTVTSLFARGGESDYSLVLVDGVRANAFGGGFDFSQLPSSNIERIEIVRGAGSALFGSDAIGAVVQVITRQAGRPRAEATLEGGSLGTTRLTASSSGSHGRWSWGGAVERIASDGFTGTAPATGERVSNDDYRSHQAMGTATWRASGGTEVALNGGWITSDRGFPGAFGSNPAGLFTGVDRLSRGVTDTRQAGASLVAPFANRRVRQHAQVSWFDLANDFTSLFGLSSSGTRRVTARSQTDIALDANTKVSAGVDLQHEHAQNTFITAGSASSPVPIVRNLVGVFGEVRHQHGSRLTMSGGLRTERVQRNALEGSPNPFTPRPPFPADTVHAVNPKASASYLVYMPGADAAGARHGVPLRILQPAWVRVRASGGTGMRAPDAFEIAFTDNPHLKPERSRSAEAGIESAFAGGQAVVELTYFANRYNDLIVAVGPAIRNASQYQTDNIANARSRGLELAARLRTSWGLAAQVAYTWLDTAVLAVDRSGGQAPPPFHAGDYLLRRPRHQGSVDLVFSRGPLTAYSQVGARSRTLDVEPTYGAFGGLFWNPGFATVRCGVGWRLVRSVELVGRVDNLFDRRYEETFGFPALGRTVMAGVRVAAGR